MVYFRNYLISILLGILLLLQAGCSWMGVRSPATNSKVSNVSFDEAFTFVASAQLSKKEQKQLFIDSLNFQGANTIQFEFVPASDLPPQTSFKMEMDVTKDKYTYRIFHSKTAFKDSGAMYELGSFIHKIKNAPALGHTFSMFEMYYNAKEGDPTALDNFLKIRAHQNSLYSSLFEEDLSENYFNRTKAFEEIRHELIPSIKEQKAKRKALDESRKTILDKLDKAPEGKQFRALVANGDRQGVADLLKKYLPFEDMAPFERRFWETHIEIIQNPVPLDQRVLIYRGLNDDYIHSAVVSGEELSKVDAINESKAFVMSSVLVKNQGSWNRRLRSLEAMNEKFIGTISESSEYAQSARISTMFLKHASDPKGSPFISLTPNIGIAQSFGSSQLMSALIDPRLIHFNYVSSFDNEIEFLMPLTTFPDEMAGLWTSSSGEELNQALEEKLKVRISDEFGKAKADEIIKRIKKNSADFFGSVYSGPQPKINKVVGGSMADFYKKFAKAGTIKPAMTPKGDLTCRDLIKIFWAVP